MQTQIRNHPPAEPVRLARLEDWQEVFADEALLGAIANYTRLHAERGRAHQAVQEAERGLQQAALADRDALAAAIGEGTSLPKSDAHARKAQEALAEASRLQDATREAFSQSSHAVERVIGERSDVVLADLERRILRRGDRSGGRRRQAGRDLRAPRRIAPRQDVRPDPRCPLQLGACIGLVGQDDRAGALDHQRAGGGILTRARDRGRR